MFESLKLFKIFGVDIKVHWSWLLMFILVIDFSDPIGEMLISALMVVMIFTIVLVHEFGHIFAGRRYGLNTPKIVLSFLGGAAFMEDGLETLAPKKALWVAFAGPLTNLIMFLILVPFYEIVLGDFEKVELLSSWQMFYIIAVMANVMMFVFNLLPIFPMDGGRLLRSTLELFKVRNSFMISVMVTQIFCIGIIVLGIYLGNISMPIIGLLFFITSIFEVKKKKDSKEMELLKKSIIDSLILKIKSIIEDEGMSDSEKLKILDEFEETIISSNSVDLIKDLNGIIDEFRKDIKGA